LVEREKLLTTIPRLSTEWSVALDYRIFGLLDEWAAMFHCSNSTGYGEWGSRIPLVSVHPNSTFRVAAIFAVDNNWTYDVSFGEVSDFNKTNHLEIHQRYVRNGDYRYYVIYNGREIHSKIHKDATQFYNVKCWATWVHEAPCYDFKC